MYFDLEDSRPDTPRVPSGASRGAGVLLSIVFHAVGVLAIVVVPAAFTGHALMKPEVERETVRYVQMTPRVDRSARPKRPAEMSDIDRKSTTPIKPLNPENSAPYSRGNTPEKTEAVATPPATGADATSQGAGATSTDVPSKVSPDAPVLPAGPSGQLGDTLRNLQRYLKDQNFNNLRGGLTEQDPDIQFDAKGVEFGPWLRRFVAQVKSNWNVPQSAMAMPGRVVIQFHVMKNGAIRDLQIVKPSSIEGYTVAAFTALKLSNPTLALPTEYPAESAFFTVTFHYNERRP